nr:septal ring lytic transglycosylase RlpA family protein [Hydrococcus rivularis]
MNQKFLGKITTTAFATILGTTTFLGNSQIAAVASNIDSTERDRISETTEKAGASNEIAKPLSQAVTLGDRATAVITFLDFPVKEKDSTQVKSKSSKTASVQAGVKQMRGMASWYGPGFHGRQTANGERFNQNDLTAAHRSLPFGTKVRVTNMNNGRSVIVRINDRGPFVGGRAIDLSAAAARAIGLHRSGVGPVNLEILGQ